MPETATPPRRSFTLLPVAPALAEAAAACDTCCLPATPPLDEAEAARSAAVLRALADPHRLRMLALIATQPAEAPLCACDVEAAFDLSQPTISHHLKVLREAGLIDVSKRGLWHHYSLRPEGLAPLRELLGALDRRSGFLPDADARSAR